MKKKAFRLLAVLVCIILTFSACGKTSGDDGVQPISVTLETEYERNQTIDFTPVLSDGYTLAAPGGIVIKKLTETVVTDPDANSYAFSEDGDYTVTYKAKKGGSTKTLDKQFKIVEPADLQPISAALDVEYEAGDPIDVTPVVTDGYQLTRVHVTAMVGGTLIDEVTLEGGRYIYTFENAGTFKVNYTAVKGLKTKTNYEAVRIVEPSQPINISLSAQYELNDTVNLAASAAGGYVLSKVEIYEIDEGTESFVANVTNTGGEYNYTFDKTGIFKIVYTAANGGKTRTNSAQIEIVSELNPIDVSQVPSAAYVGVATDLTPVIKNNTYSLTEVSVKDSSAAPIQPEEGGNNIYIFDSADTYTIEYTAKKGAEGEERTASTTITVTYAPAPDLNHGAATKGGYAGYKIAIDPVIEYEGDMDSLEIEVKAFTSGSSDVTGATLTGDFDDGDLAFKTSEAGTYTIKFIIEYPDADSSTDMVELSYDIVITALGTKATLVTNDSDYGVVYQAKADNTNNASAHVLNSLDTSKFHPNTFAGSLETKFRIQNQDENLRMNWSGEGAANDKFMPLFIIFDRLDGLYDILALDFSSTSWNNGASNIGQLNDKKITMRMKIGTDSLNLNLNDSDWIKGLLAPDSEKTAIGGGQPIYTSVRRDIVFNAESGEMAANYKVSFNLANESATNYTFSTSAGAVASSHTGPVKIGFATANTRITLRDVAIFNTVAANYNLETDTDTPVNLTSVTYGQHVPKKDGGPTYTWALVGSISVVKANGEIVNVTDFASHTFTEAGDYYVIYTVQTNLNNHSSVKKQSVATFKITVTEPE